MARRAGFSRKLFLDVENADEVWRLRAQCRPGNGHDPETWFPPPRASAEATNHQRRIAQLRRAEQINRAVAVCLQCAVRRQCLDYAIANGEDDGIWGGLVEEQRRRIKRKGDN